MMSLEDLKTIPSHKVVKGGLFLFFLVIAFSLSVNTVIAEDINSDNITTLTKPSPLPVKEIELYDDGNVVKYSVNYEEELGQWVKLSWKVEVDDTVTSADLNMKLNYHDILPSTYWTKSNTDLQRDIETEWENRSRTVVGGEVWTGYLRYKLTRDLISSDYPRPQTINLAVYDNFEQTNSSEEVFNGDSGYNDGRMDELQYEVFHWIGVYQKKSVFADTYVSGIDLDANFGDSEVLKVRDNFETFFKFPLTMPDYYGIGSVRLKYYTENILPKYSPNYYIKTKYPPSWLEDNLTYNNAVFDTSKTFDVEHSSSPLFYDSFEDGDISPWTKSVEYEEYATVKSGGMDGDYYLEVGYGYMGDANATASLDLSSVGVSDSNKRGVSFWIESNGDGNAFNASMRHSTGTVFKVETYEGNGSISNDSGTVETFSYPTGTWVKVVVEKDGEKVEYTIPSLGVSGSYSQSGDITKFRVQCQNTSDSDLEAHTSLDGLRVYGLSDGWVSADITDAFTYSLENESTYSTFPISLVGSPFNIRSREYDGYEPYIEVQYYPVDSSDLAEPVISAKKPILGGVDDYETTDEWGNTGKNATVNLRGEIENLKTETDGLNLYFYLDSSSSLGDATVIDYGKKDSLGLFETSLGGLVTNTTYYFRIKATSSMTGNTYWYPENKTYAFTVTEEGVTVEEAEEEEEEEEVEPPSIIWRGIEEITDTSVRASFDVDLNNNTSGTVTLQYTDNENATSYSEVTKTISESGTVRLVADGLSENTDYWIRGKINAGGYVDKCAWDKVTTKESGYDKPSEEEGEPEVSWDVTQLDDLVAQRMGVSELIGGFFISMIFIVVITVVILCVIFVWGSGGSNVALPLMFVDFPVMGFFILLGWLPYWIPILLFLFAGILWAGKIKLGT